MITKETNQKIIEFIKQNAWAGWMGFVIGSLGVTVISLDFWIYLMGMIFLVNLSKKIHLEKYIQKLKEKEIEEKSKERKENLDFFR